jgi:predicted nuclease of restriction endonuclease-like RecB superfamily
MIEKDYSYDEIMGFLKIYLTPKFGSKLKFINELTNYNVEETDAELMWKCFDMVTEKYDKYGSILKMVKEMGV